MEIWRQIDGYSAYQVSNLGRVKSLKGNEKFLKPRNSNGYKKVSLYSNGYYKTFSIHRLVAIAFIPNPENKPQINHIDGNKTNNCVSNLEWVTASENIKHSYKTGLNPLQTGKSNPNYNDAVYRFYHPASGELECTIEEFTQQQNIDRAYLRKLTNGQRKSIRGWSIMW